MILRRLAGRMSSRKTPAYAGASMNMPRHRGSGKRDRCGGMMPYWTS